MLTPIEADFCREYNVPRYSVFHAINPAFGVGETDFSGFELVAYVYSDRLEMVFSKTNHGAGMDYWPDNSGVECLLENPRSTSVGDIIREPGGDYYLVEFVGFRQVLSMPRNGA